MNKCSKKNRFAPDIPCEIGHMNYKCCENYKSGGEILRELRQEKKLSLKQLGNLAKVSYVYLSKLERGFDRPSEKLIRRVADILNYRGDINEFILRFGIIPEEIKEKIFRDPDTFLDLYYLGYVE